MRRECSLKKKLTVGEVPRAAVDQFAWSGGGFCGCCGHGAGMTDRTWNYHKNIPNIPNLLSRPLSRPPSPNHRTHNLFVVHYLSQDVRGNRAKQHSLEIISADFWNTFWNSTENLMTSWQPCQVNQPADLLTLLSIIWERMSMGTGKMTVELFSAEMLFNVCR